MTETGQGQENDGYIKDSVEVEDKPRLSLELDYEKDVKEYLEGNFMQKFAYYRDYPFRKLAAHPTLMKGVIYAVLFILYNAYFFGVLARYIKHDLPWEWCDKFGFLIILTIITYVGLIYYQIVKRFFGTMLYNAFIDPFEKAVAKVFASSIVSGIGYLVVVIIIAVVIVVDSWDEPQRLISAAGVVILVLFGFVFSAHPGHVRWRHVVWGIGLQFLFGLIVLRWQVELVKTLSKANNSRFVSF